MNGLQAEKNTVSNEHWFAKAKFGINGTDIKLTENSIYKNLMNFGNRVQAAAAS